MKRKRMVPQGGRDRLRQRRFYPTFLLGSLILLLGMLSPLTTLAQDTEASNKTYLPLVIGNGTMASEQQVADEAQTPAMSDALSQTGDSSVTASAQSLTLYPTDDTYANQYEPAATRGDRAIIHVNGDTTRTKYGYLKFNLNPLPAGTYVSKATLRLYAQTTTQLALGAFHVANDAWSETTLTWNNRPAADSTQLSAVSATTANTYAQFDVTAAVTSAGLHSFSLVRLSTTNLDVTFSSKESTTGKPELVITYASCAPGLVDDKLVPRCGALLGGWSARANIAWKSAIEQHEAMIGRKLDVIRNFHPPEQHYQALSSEEKTLILAGRTLLIGYRPAARWADAGGGNATLNQEITNLANSVKSVAPRKVMIILFHEPERFVIGSGGNPGNAGTPAEYVQMWRNVRARFNSAGVTNVVWVWNVQNIATYRNLLPQLWPGNEYVDWVMWNPYVGAKDQALVTLIQEGYTWLAQNSDAQHNYVSKPWGFGEWGIGVNNYIPSAAKQASEYRTLRDTLNSATNPLPKLKLLAVFDANESTIQTDAAAAYREFASSPYLQLFLLSTSAPVVRAQEAFTTNTPTTSRDDVLQEVKQVAAGDAHTCVVTMAGGVLCWGSNDTSQTGGASRDNFLLPTAINGLTTPVQAIATGMENTCLLTESGAVQCWGAATYGALGSSPKPPSKTATPVDVAGLSNGVTAISAGDLFACGLLTTGSVKCWGHNDAGQLGNGNTTNQETPVDVSGLNDGKLIVTGYQHACALTKGGGVKCWGYNHSGQLGNGTTTNKHMPVDVVGLNNGVTAIATGWYHTCALTSTGGVQCWGANSASQLGNGESTIDHSLTPVQVSGLNSGVIAISAGRAHTCALLTDGSVKCWGDNGNGQLGDGTTTMHTTPVAVNGLPAGILSIASFSDHTCAVTATHTLKCWGNNRDGQLGNGSRTILPTPHAVQNLTRGATALAVNNRHSCAVINPGNVMCWGENDSGQLGDDTLASHTAPIEVKGLNHPLVAVSVGYDHTCGVTDQGGLRCWGSNFQGQLGIGVNVVSQTMPVDVSGLTTDVADVVAGFAHTCALMTNGGVKCWGSNSDGQLGDGTTDRRSVPGDVVMLSDAVQLATQSDHTCAVTNTGAVTCWGDNSQGQLGIGSTTDSTTPVTVSGLSSGVVQVATGNKHSCALLAGGTIKCWGQNSSYQLGDGTFTDRLTPVDVKGLPGAAQSIAAGYDHTCALLTTGAVYCWGGNWDGQLGIGTIGSDSKTPVQVSTIANDGTAIAAGWSYGCAITTGGAVSCWGDGRYGNLGDGFPRTPVDVLATKPLTQVYLPLIKK